MKIITRKEAMAQGLKRYFTGKPCSKGHIAERYVHSICVECQRAQSRAYYAANPEKINAQARAWAGTNREKVRMLSRTRYAKNPEKDLARARNSRVENPEKFRVRYQIWRVANIEKARASVRAWCIANPDKCNAQAAKRKANKLRATPSWITQEQIRQMAAIYANAKRREAMTGVDWHVDHVVPLQGKNVCGLHVPWNLQLLSAEENLKKGNKLLEVA